MPVTDLALGNSLPLLPAVFQFLVIEVGLRAGAILLCGLLLISLFGRGAAAGRSALWCILICGLLLMPVLHRVVPALTIPLTVDSGWGYLAPLTDLGSLTTHPVARLLAAVYLIVAIFLLIRILSGMLRMRQLSRQAIPVDDPEARGMLAMLQRRNGIAVPVEILCSATLASPVTWGLRRHLILLPASYKRWQPAVLQQCLSHELAHIQRMDWLGQLMARVLLALYWPNPLAWLLCRDYLEECEKACDEAVVDDTGNALAYAENLLWLTSQLRRQAPRAAPGWLGSKSILHRRIHHILNNEMPHINNGRSHLVVGLLFSLILVSVPASLQFRLTETTAQTQAGATLSRISYRVTYYPRGSGGHASLLGEFGQSRTLD